MKLKSLVLLLCLASLPGTAEAKSYSAERFDAVIRILEGGVLEVTETVVFRFEEGTFKEVFRDIPRRRTDGVEIVAAGMDGQDMPFGDGPGQVEIRRRSRLRVLWRFPEPVSPSTHAFTLTYRVKGAIRQAEGDDLLAWRALPGEHNYTIDTSTIEVAHAARLARAPEIRRNRVTEVQVTEDAGSVRVTATGIRKNGWVEAWMWFPGGTLITAPPAWQEAQLRADALAPRWLWGAAFVIAAGLVLLWSMRQRYQAPPPDGSIGANTVFSAPDDVAPAIAGALASNGRPAMVHAMSTVFALADRGEIAIREEPKGTFGQRNFTLERLRTGRPLAPHEDAVLDAVFTHRGSKDASVALAKARSRLMSNSSRFRTAVRGEMSAAGLIDRERQGVHARYGAASLTIILLAAALFVAAALLVREYRGWPMLIPGALMVVGLVGFMFQASTTPLSNEGARRAARWRAYQKHLKAVARQEAHLTSESPTRVLPYAIGLGLAATWAKFVKSQPSFVPPWFQALSASDDGAFHAFVAYGGAAGDGGGGAGGGAGGAAGGGGSGAG